MRCRGILSVFFHKICMCSANFDEVFAIYFCALITLKLPCVDFDSNCNPITKNYLSILILLLLHANNDLLCFDF